MDAAEQRAILNILIHAALADGGKSDAERAAVRDAAESLSGGSGAALAGVYQDVLLKRVTLADAAAALSQPEHRQLAYEMAVCVCDADGVQGEAERAFLAALRGHLGLADGQAQAGAVDADAIAAAAWEPAPRAAQPPLLQSRVSDAELDKTILNASILNGALELLPQSWASMAIIPLQVRLVYRIGKAHGVELDQGHIKEFLATVGVGLTGQYIEQVGRKLVSGLLGKAAGRMIGGLGGAATSVAFSFATTWALGHLAKRYYAGGRVMSTDLLKRTYQELFATAKGAQQQYLPAIQQRASTLTATEVVEMVRR